MTNVVDMSGKPFTDESNNSFPEWCAYVEKSLSTHNETIGMLINAHNEVVARIGQLETVKKTKKKRWGWF